MSDIIQDILLLEMAVMFPVAFGAVIYLIVSDLRQK